MSNDAASLGKDRTSDGYVVVARRYRPLSFEQLVGQAHVARALSNAITTDRVGHAYLFTGARGVGKTSTARIFAKALNDPSGPTVTPDGETDVAKAIDAGEDVDVLEIDGASNRGIDEIRQLRANVNVRPSRSRYKIYIIDEVHMLTTAAFNALLKTLEEPPPHVKFIFCTTDPEKIPITVLSRCQRYDFSPVDTESIAERLRFIVRRENVEADDEAIRLLARRAGGSMRDSQSLLEQLLAFGGDRIGLEDVHAMLGTARGGRLDQVARLLVARDAAGALSELDKAVSEGVDVGQLAEQLVGYFRDVMAAAVGCDAELMLNTDPQDHPRLKEIGQEMGLSTVLAVIQILDQAIARMRQTTQVRTLVELALVRICDLENLDDLAELIARLESGREVSRGPAKPAVSGSVGKVPRPPAQKKTTEPRSTGTHASGTHASGTHASANLASANLASGSDTSGTHSSGTDGALSGREGTGSVPDGQELTAGNVTEWWGRALADLGDMTADAARCAQSVAISAPNRLVVTFGAPYTLQKETCERRADRLEQAISGLVGHPVRLVFRIEPENGLPAQPAPPVSRVKQMREKESDPLVRQAIELFDAEIIRLDPGGQ